MYIWKGDTIVNLAQVRHIKRIEDTFSVILRFGFSDEDFVSFEFFSSEEIDLWIETNFSEEDRKHPLFKKLLKLLAEVNWKEKEKEAREVIEEIAAKLERGVNTKLREDKIIWKLQDAYKLTGRSFFKKLLDRIKKAKDRGRSLVRSK